MNSLQRALLDAGLITQQQYEKQQEQMRLSEERGKKKEISAIRGTAFPSLRSFMDHAKRELRKNSTGTRIGALIRQAHEVSDELRLSDKKRRRMHAFLAKVAEGLSSRLPEDRLAFLDEVFLALDPKLVSEE